MYFMVEIFCLPTGNQNRRTWHKEKKPVSSILGTLVDTWLGIFVENFSMSAKNIKSGVLTSKKNKKERTAFKTNMLNLFPCCTT